VGHIAVQLAHHCGAYVIGTVSTANLEAARGLELDEIVDHTTTRFEEVVDQVDLVFDTAGGDRLVRSPSVVRPGGKLVSVASEPSQERAAAYGIEALYFVVEPNGQQLSELTRWVDDGQLRPVIAGVFGLAQARQAFERSLMAHPTGKIVLRVAED
jgi:NADPH:quinone reductase-like Zn-dependent oxidoreductase